jgi:hypothetical protein
MKTIVYLLMPKSAVINFLLLLGLMTFFFLVHTLYLAFFQSGSSKKGWLKFQLIGWLLIFIGIYLATSAAWQSYNPEEQLYLHYLYCGLSVMFVMGGILVLDLSYLGKLRCVILKKNWLGLMISGWIIFTIGLFFLFICDEVKVVSPYYVLCLGFITCLIGGIFMHVAKDKSKKILCR